MKVCVMLTVALVLLWSAVVTAAPAEDLQKRGTGLSPALFNQLINELNLNADLKKKLLSGSNPTPAVLNQVYNDLGLSDDLKNILTSKTLPSVAGFQKLIGSLGLSDNLVRKLNTLVTVNMS